MEAKRLRKVNVLGLPFVAEPKQVFLKEHLKPRIDKEQKTFIVTANPEIVMEAYLNKAYFDAIKHATYIVPDGIGIIYAAKINKEKIKERIPGVELVEDCLNYANDNQLSCCFLGASPEVNKRLQVKLKQEYPNIDIKVTRHGYYAQEEEQEIISELVHAEADFNFIALGYPKQEEFIFNNFNQFNKGIFVGVGGSFDVLSGSVKRAPKIFIKFNLEWLYRLLKQPTRLFRSFNLVRFLLTVYFRKKRKA